MLVNSTQSPSSNVLIEYNENNEMAVVMKLRTGDQFPVRINLSGDVIQMSPVEEIVTVAKTVFMKMGGNINEPCFRRSENEDWKDFTAFFTGELGCFLSCSDENGELLTGQIDLSIYNRE